MPTQCLEVGLAENLKKVCLPPRIFVIPLCTYLLAHSKALEADLRAALSLDFSLCLCARAEALDLRAAGLQDLFLKLFSFLPPTPQDLSLPKYPYP